MVALGAELADGLLFSMVTADHARAIAARPEGARHRSVTTYNYHRVAIDPGGRGPAYAPRWSRTVSRPWARSICSARCSPRGATRAPCSDADLATYPADWRPVFRPLPTKPAELDEWRDLFAALAPIGR